MYKIFTLFSVDTLATKKINFFDEQLISLGLWVSIYNYKDIFG